jgi:hypothetical protein
MKPTSDKKPKKQTKVALAKTLGISPQLLNHHLKNPLAPKDLGDVDAWAEFLLSSGRDASLPPELRESIGSARLRNLILDAERKETQNRRERRELIDFAEASRALREFSSVVTFATLDRLKREFAVTMVGRTSLEIDTLMEEQIERARKLARDACDAFDKMGPSKKEAV